MDLRSLAWLGTTNLASPDLERTVVQFWTWVLKRDWHPKWPNSRSERTSVQILIWYRFLSRFPHDWLRISSSGKIFEKPWFFSGAIQIWRSEISGAERRSSSGLGFLSATGTPNHRTPDLNELQFRSWSGIGFWAAFRTIDCRFPVLESFPDHHEFF